MSSTRLLTLQNKNRTSSSIIPFIREVSCENNDKSRRFSSHRPHGAGQRHPNRTRWRAAAVPSSHYNQVWLPRLSGMSMKEFQRKILKSCPSPPRSRQGIKLPLWRPLGKKVSSGSWRGHRHARLCGSVEEEQVSSSCRPLLWCCLHGPAAVMWCSGESDVCDTCCQADLVNGDICFRLQPTKQKLGFRHFILKSVVFVTPAPKPILLNDLFQSCCCSLLWKCFNMT